MVGEPTTYPKAWFDAFPEAADATPLLASARAIKTEQEIARMRLANEIAAGAMEHVQGRIRPGMRESEVGALWNGWVHDHGTGFDGGKVELAHGFSLVWSGPGSAPSRPRAVARSRSTSRPSSRSGSSPTATGATTRRTSSRGSSTRATPSSSRG